MKSMNLTDHFLIAMPSLGDPNFRGTVTYMCAHNDEGAMGIIINRPSDLHLGDVLSHLDMPVEDGAVADQVVLQGGPVQTERGFVIHEPPGEWDSMLKVGERLGVATSRDILAAVARGDGPRRAVVALGYAGWGAGQLEQEVLANAWLSGPADSSIIFDLPYEERWASATRMLGVDPDHLMGGAGHA